MRLPKRIQTGIKPRAMRAHLGVEGSVDRDRGAEELVSASEAAAAAAAAGSSPV